MTQEEKWAAVFKTRMAEAAAWSEYLAAIAQAGTICAAAHVEAEAAYTATIAKLRESQP